MTGGSLRAALSNRRSLDSRDVDTWCLPALLGGGVLVTPPLAAVRPSVWQPQKPDALGPLRMDWLALPAQRRLKSTNQDD